MRTTEEKAAADGGRLSAIVASLEVATERGDLGAIIEGVMGLKRLVRDAGEPADRGVQEVMIGELMATLRRPAGPAPDWRIWSPLLGITAAAAFGGHLAVATQQPGRAVRVRPIREVYADAGVVHLLTTS